MIASVRGAVLASGPDWVVVSLGGMGLRVEVPPRAVTSVGSEIALHTHLIVREDALTLYGFESADELEVFGILLGVSGVGPRSALGVLSTLTPAQIATAVSLDDEKPFRKVSGIGPKTAKLISVQLSGKLDPQRFAVVSEGVAVDHSPTGAHAAGSVIAGLTGLGYAEAQAVAAVEDAQASGAPDDEAGLLRAALALLQAPRTGNRS